MAQNLTIAVRIAALICSGVAVGQRTGSVFYGITASLVLWALMPEVSN